jgi:hypothetical protein
MSPIQWNDGENPQTGNSPALVELGSINGKEIRLGLHPGFVGFES